MNTTTTTPDSSHPSPAEIAAALAAYRARWDRKKERRRMARAAWDATRWGRGSGAGGSGGTGGGYSPGNGGA